MEVHHHPEVAKKNLNEYLLEGLMIFLAVMLGFISENIREHLVEREREQEFMQLLSNDVKSDMIDARNIKERRLDSLMLFLNGSSKNDHLNDIYYYAIQIPRGISTRFTPNDGTIQQLKNSGGLRLIHHLDIADSIMKYDVSVRDLLRTIEVESRYTDDYRKIATRVLNALVLDSMTDTLNWFHRPLNNPSLLPYDAATLAEYNSAIFSIKSVNRAVRRSARDLLIQAVDLEKALKEKYNTD
jgi:hypothetical protein